MCWYPALSMQSRGFGHSEAHLVRQRRVQGPYESNEKLRNATKLFEGQIHGSGMLPMPSLRGPCTENGLVHGTSTSNSRVRETAGGRQSPVPDRTVHGADISTRHECKTNLDVHIRHPSRAAFTGQGKVLCALQSQWLWQRTGRCGCSTNLGLCGGHLRTARAAMLWRSSLLRSWGLAGHWALISMRRATSLSATPAR